MKHAKTLKLAAFATAFASVAAVPFVTSGVEAVPRYSPRVIRQIVFNYRPSPPPLTRADLCRTGRAAFCGGFSTRGR
ncbi:hypothetical protein B2G71_18065 [Novosphingobium sp. PC22D]|uniref:hypothetical protein n=1 Tax=Novosphingobium sp. PC22D TaxID=1962403 RepID=UPI000BF01899|nr:hypothetical protein [Novosphingobium sp. PC22D]PEQ11195.1 hypothetical protein B2G71_18065 [Novosphingobium sp. PC22D]